MTAISARTVIDFDMVKSIAGYCNGVDPSWYRGLRENGQTQGAVQECHVRLHKLAPKVTHCCAIVFPEIRGRWQSKVATESVVIHHRNCQVLEGLKDVYGQIDYTIAPADTEVAEFYLLHKNKVCQYRLDPSSRYVHTATSYNSEGVWDISTWDISAGIVETMSSAIWNGSFVTTSHVLCHVMPIPTVENSAMKQ